MNATPPLIRLKDISFNYPGRKPVLNHLDFTFHEGDRVGLMAPNGSGKTTFFHLIMGLHQPTAGTLEFFGKAVADANGYQEIRRRIGLLFKPVLPLYAPLISRELPVASNCSVSVTTSSRSIAETDQAPAKPVPPLWPSNSPGGYALKESNAICTATAGDAEKSARAANMRAA